jgi:hypothetical protein
MFSTDHLSDKFFLRHLLTLAVKEVYLHINIDK